MRSLILAAFSALIFAHSALAGGGVSGGGTGGGIGARILYGILKGEIISCVDVNPASDAQFECKQAECSYGDYRDYCKNQASETDPSDSQDQNLNPSENCDS